MAVDIPFHSASSPDIWTICEGDRITRGVGWWSREVDINGRARAKSETSEESRKFRQKRCTRQAGDCTLLWKMRAYVRKGYGDTRTNSRVTIREGCGCPRGERNGRGERWNSNCYLHLEHRLHMIPATPTSPSAMHVLFPPFFTTWLSIWDFKIVCWEITKLLYDCDFLHQLVQFFQLVQIQLNSDISDKKFIVVVVIDNL